MQKTGYAEFLKADFASLTESFLTGCNADIHWT